MEVALELDLRACTDITGFGIAGHLLEVAQGCGSTVRLEFSRLPVYPADLDMYRKGVGTGSNLPNRVMVQDHLEIEATLSRAEEQILFDPQTSGGLLLSVPESQADELLSHLEAAGETSAARVGEVIEGPAALVVV